jgi:hypothetical protein
MGQIVAGIGISHTAQVFRKRDPKREAQNRFVETAEAVARWLESLNPDVAIVVSSEHLVSFFLDNFPMYCVGLGPYSDGWGEAGVPRRRVPVPSALAQQLHQGLVARGFDPAFAHRLRLDHGFMTPIHLLFPRLDVPVIPVFQNCVIPPFPPPSRSFAFGRALAEVVVQDWPEDLRAVVVGAGGLSHWVAVPKMGHINAEFDQRFLRWCESMAYDRIQALSAEEIERESGNGGQEIRHWITVVGAVQRPLYTRCYVPVPEWVTGMAVATT